MIANEETVDQPIPPHHIRRFFMCSSAIGASLDKITTKYRKPMVVMGLLRLVSDYEGREFLTWAQERKQRKLRVTALNLAL